MLIQLSDLKSNPAMFFDLAKTTEVIVTKHGKKIGRIVSEETAAKNDSAHAFAELIRLTSAAARPDDTVYDPVTEERLRGKGLL